MFLLKIDGFCSTSTDPKYVFHFFHVERGGRARCGTQNVQECPLVHSKIFHILVFYLYFIDETKWRNEDYNRKYQTSSISNPLLKHI